MPRGREGEAVSDVLMPQGCEDKGRDCNPGVPEAALGFLGHFSRHSFSGSALRAAYPRWARALSPGAPDTASWQGSGYPGLLCATCCSFGSWHLSGCRWIMALLQSTPSATHISLNGKDAPIPFRSLVFNSSMLKNDAK